MNLLMIAGIIVAIVATVWFLVIAFKESILWGLGCLLVPIVGIVFFFLNIKRTWKPVALHALGILMLLPGMLGVADNMESMRNSRPVPLPVEKPMDSEMIASLIMKLKDEGIKYSFTLGTVYVPADQVDRAMVVYKSLINTNDRKTD